WGQGGAGAGAWRYSVDHEHRFVLRGVAARSVEFHHDDAEHARPRNVVDAASADMLGVVHDGGSRVALVSGAFGGGHSAFARPPRGHKLLHTRRGICKRQVDHGALGGLADSLAALVLVLRTSRS